MTSELYMLMIMIAICKKNSTPCNGMLLSRYTIDDHDDDAESPPVVTVTLVQSHWNDIIRVIGSSQALA
jgi:hypothetical protein